MTTLTFAAFGETAQHVIAAEEPDTPAAHGAVNAPVLVTGLYSASWETWLKKQGIVSETGAWTDRFPVSALESMKLLVLAYPRPEKPLSAAENARIKQWLSNGGLAIVTSGAPALMCADPDQRDLGSLTWLGADVYEYGNATCALRRPASPLVAHVTQEVLNSPVFKSRQPFMGKLTTGINLIGSADAGQQLSALMLNIVGRGRVLYLSRPPFVELDPVGSPALEKTVQLFVRAALGKVDRAAIDAGLDAVTLFEDMSGFAEFELPASVWVDYDQDGWLDQVDRWGSLWRNENGRRFTPVKGGSIPGYRDCGDYDNDGLLDVVSLKGPVLKLHRGLRNGRFEAVEVKLSAPPPNGVGAVACGDVNGDAFLDLYLGGYEHEHWTKYQPDAMYLNNGKLGFTEVYRTPGRPQPTRDLEMVDFDEDGDLDIYISHYRLEANVLWLNDGKGRFTNAAPAFGATGGLAHTVSSAWGDLDNDGHLDLFVGNFSHQGQPESQFLMNLGPGGKFHFKDMSATAALVRQESFAVGTLGDYDNDGDLDLLLTTVYGGDHFVLLRNDGGWKFTDVTGTTGIRNVTTYGATWGDYDNDGYLDLMYGSKIFRNRGGQNHWLKVCVRGDGTTVPVTAIGTQVRLKWGNRVLTRHVARTPRVLHYGLGKSTGPLTLEVRWMDGTRQTLQTPVDRLVTVRKEP